MHNSIDLKVLKVQAMLGAYVNGNVYIVYVSM